MAETSATRLLENLKLNVPDIGNLPVSKLPISKELKYIDRTVEQVVSQAPWMVLKVGTGILIMVLGWMLSGWLATRMHRFLVRARMEETLAAFLASTTRFVLFFNILIVAATVIGVSSTSMAALLGAIGLAVGFALRGTLGSIAGGVMLMAHRPIKAGDWVEITSPQGSPSGTVKRIGLFSTEINTRDFVRVFVPNAMLWESVLRNDTYNRMRMTKVDFGLAQVADVKRAFGIVRAMLAANPLALKTPEPLLVLESINEHGLMCSLEVWTRTEDRRALKNTILFEILETLQKEGIGLAYMKTDAGKTAKVKPVKSKKKV